MKLGYDIYGPPPPLCIGSGENQFGLRVARANPVQRMAIIDAIAANSYAAAWAVAAELITGWDRLFNADGSPIPFEGTDVATQQPVKNAARVFAALPLTTQAEALLALLAFAGIPSGQVKSVATSLGIILGAEFNTDPTSPPQNTSGGDASGSPST